MRFGIEAIDGSEGELRDVEAIVDIRDGLDFLSCGEFLVIEQGEEDVAFGLRRTLESVDEEERLLATEDIATDFLAKHGGITVDIQIIILKLESQTNLFGKTIEHLSVGIGSIGDKGTHLGGTGEKNGGLETNHLNVFRLRDVGALLEIHVILLTLANLLCGTGKKTEYISLTTAATLHDQLESQDQHRVTREHSRVLVPFLMDRQLAASHIGMIHEVIMEKRMVMVGFQTDGCRNSFVRILAVEAMGKQQKSGSQTFAAHAEDVADGFVETFGFGRIGNVAEGSIDAIEKCGHVGKQF